MPIIVDDDDDETGLLSSDSIDEPIPRLPDFLDFYRSNSASTSTSATNVTFSVENVANKMDRKGKGKERSPVLNILDNFDGISDERSTSPKRSTNTFRMDRSVDMDRVLSRKRDSGNDPDRAKKKARSLDHDELVGLFSYNARPTS